MISLFLSLLFLTTPASVIELKQEFLSKGGSAKAFSHLECIYKKYQGRSFETRIIEKADHLIPRCNQIEGGANFVSANRNDVAVVVDYTKKGNEKRLFILDGHHGIVSTHYVSHGSYQADSKNRSLRPLKNSLEWVKYFSNTDGSRASATGLYITGKAYQGYWKGPEGDKYSMVLHGVESNINDMACERTIVMHGNSGVKERGFGKGANEMSSGCFMVDYELINKMVARLRGTDDSGGSYFFVYGPREAEMDASAYCQ